jgi:RNA polymerase sigma factor (sigma-70 family)
MDERQWLAERFEANRAHLRGVAYRMLGSLSEADDAVQDAWLRISRADTSGVENMAAWLTTVVARVCLNMLQSRKSRREEPFEFDREPDPVVSRADGLDPEHEVLVADSVGLAMLVVLDALAPAERVAFVLHDVFGVSFEEIAPIVGRSSVAARQLASRARRRVHATAPPPDTDLAAQRLVVDAFLAAARGGDFEALVAILDPDVVLRSEAAPGVTRIVRGAHAVATGAKNFSRVEVTVVPVLVNGAAGFASFSPDGRPASILGFTVVRGKIVAIDALSNPERLARLKLDVLLPQ